MRKYRYTVPHTGRRPTARPRQPPLHEQVIAATSIAKVDDTLGILFGWALICNIDGRPYYDLQGDHVPEDAMLRAVAEFSEQSRVGKIMHAGEQAGSVVFSLPVTDELNKALGLNSNRTGWIVGFKPHDRAVLDKFRDGTFSGFSIGGKRIKDKEVA